MNILHIPHAYHPVVGGAEYLCRRVSEELAARGHTVNVLTSDVASVEAYYQFGIKRVTPVHEVINNVTIQRLPYADSLYCAGGWINNITFIGAHLANRLAGINRQRFIRMVAESITAYKPDVVMTMPHLVTNVLAVLATKKKHPFPLVMVPMLHEHDSNWNIPDMTAALQQTEAVIAMTTHEADRLVDAYHVPQQKIFLASPGVDFDKEPQFQSVYKRIIFLGRKSRTKGIEQLIAAMRIVWEKIADAELWLVGPDSPDIASINAAIAHLPDNMQAMLHNVDSVVGDAKSELLGSATCLVLPSKIESFGMVLLDAWSHAKPVITWDLPVFRSIIEPGQDGLLVPADNVELLAAAIFNLLEDRVVAEKLGKAGYDKATARYTWKNSADGYLDAYQYAIRSFSQQ